MSKLRTACVAATLAFSFAFGATVVPAGASTSPINSAPASSPIKSATAAVAPVQATGPLQREVFGFAFGNASLADPTYGYPSWSFNLLSTVAYFGLDIRWDGAISQTGGGWATWNSAALTGLVNAAHAAHTRVILSIDLQDFNGSPTSTMCAALHPLHRAVTVRQALAQVQKMHVDGVNIDFEGVNNTCAYGATTRAEMTSLAKEMRAALGSLYLSVDTYGGSAADPYGFFDVAGMARYVDSFFVMAYDMEYSNQYRAPVSCSGTKPLNCLGPTSPVSAYYYNDATVAAQYVHAAGAGKVILGVPYYGRKSCVASATANASPTSTIVADSYLIASQESTDPSVLAGSYKTHRDRYTGVERWDTWYNTSLHCTRELYWDDVYSLGRKYDIVIKDGLRGAGIFALQYGGGAPELWNLLAARFTTWSASYDMTSAPLGWQPGETKTFAVTVTNTSPATWPAGGSNYTALNVHFTSRQGGIATKSSWLTNQVFKLPADLAPGASVAVPVTVTAPNKAGTYWLEAEMFRNGLYWFTARSAVGVQVAQTLWFAGYDMSAAPQTWFAGKTQAFTVKVTNTGNQAWPSRGTNPVKLDLSFATAANGSAGARTWLGSQAFLLPAAVFPGQTATVSVRMTAPSKQGGMYLQAQMFKDHQFWFGASQPIAITVGDPWLARYDLSAAPSSWSSKQTQSFTITVVNAGTQTWPATGAGFVGLHVHFTTKSGGRAAASSWLTSQVFRLPASVTPGHGVAVPVKVTAPAVTGAMYIEAELYKDHQFWFGAYQPVPVGVGAMQWSGSYGDAVHWPASWDGGQTQTFTVTVQNNGTRVWPAAGANYVALDLHFSSVAGARTGWLTSQVFRLPADIAPGQTAQIPVQVTAPARGAPVFLEASLFKDHQFWLPLAQPVPVLVAPVAWWADTTIAQAPAAWTAGKAQTFTITLKNTGTETWPAGGTHAVRLDLHFATRAGGNAAISYWLTSKIVNLPADVLPGKSVDVSVTMTPPARAGLVYLEAQLFKDHQFWIQPWQPLAVTVR